MEAEGKDVIRLVDLQPSKPPIVGHDIFRIGKSNEGTLTTFAHSRTMKPCDHFIFAHAPSSIAYRIPVGATEFNAYAYNVFGRTAKFIIEVSVEVNVSGTTDSNAKWSKVYQSPSLGWGPVIVPFNRAVNFIRLSVDPIGDNFGDHSYWLRPTFVVASNKVQLVQSMQVGNADVPGWAHFGYDSISVAQYHTPWDVYDQEETSEYLWAHASSLLTYQIPDDFTHFTAMVGDVSRNSRDFEITVRADNQEKPLYHAISPSWEFIDVSIPQNSRELFLGLNALKTHASDQAVWAYPRFHRRKSSTVVLSATPNESLDLIGRNEKKDVRVKNCTMADEVITHVSRFAPGFTNWRFVAGCLRGDDDPNGHNNFYCLHPISGDEPATIDFGAITSKNKGVLTIDFRNFQTDEIPQPGHRMVIKRNGVVLDDRPVDTVYSWQSLDISFDYDFISLEHWANGWFNEHGLYDFTVQFGENLTPRLGQELSSSPAQIQAGDTSIAAVVTAVKKHNWDGMQTIAEQAVATAANSTQIEQANILFQLVELVTFYRGAIAKSIVTLQPGNELDLANDLKAVVVETGPDTLIIRFNGKNKEYTLDTLPLSIAHKIAKLSLPDDSPTTQAAMNAYQAIAPMATPPYRDKAIAMLEEITGKVDGAEPAKLVAALRMVYQP